MNAHSPVSDMPTPQERAVVELEEHLLGWQLRGAPGISEIVSAELRDRVFAFQAPFNRVQEVIFKALDEQRTVSVLGVAAELQDCTGLAELGGVEYLQALAFRAPTVISTEDGAKQAADSINAWRRLQNPLPRIGEVELVRADQIRVTQIDWVWQDWLAAGKLHLLAGSPGTGKTTLSLSIAATITKSGPFPCGSQSSGGSVLMWTGEDDLADSIVPRFMACGGCPERLHFVKGTLGPDGETCPFDPAQHMDRLIAKAKTIEDLKLLILDPVVSAVTGDSHKNSETRRALQPLVEFAATVGAAVLGITHYSKGTAGRDPAERVTGSLAFVAVSRLVMVTAKPREEGQRWRLVRAKSNIGPDGGGFEYDLVQAPLGDGIYGQGVVWGHVLDGTARALLAEVEAPDEPRAAPALEAAQTWLQQFLGTGAAAVTAIQKFAAAMGHKWATVRRAADALGIVKKKDGLDGGWTWRMPKEPTGAEDTQP
jgi:putative DNA primase/helicase